MAGATLLRSIYARRAYLHFQQFRCHAYSLPRPVPPVNAPIARGISTSSRGINKFKLTEHSRETLVRGIQATVLFAIIGYFYPKNPLKLEGSEGELPPGVHSIHHGYLPPVKPCTMQVANEILRWEEDSHMVGQGSGVQRFDSVVLPSNNPCEDTYVAASGLTDEVQEIRWSA